MIAVIDRYFARQILQTLLAVALVLLAIFLSNRLVHYLADAAAGQLPGDIIFTLVALKGVKYLLLLLPLALYLAVLLVMGRMYKDNEMVALSACGVGVTRLYRAVMMIAVPMALIQGWMSLHVVPWSDAMELKLIARAQQQMDLSAITAGRFHEGSRGEWVIYAERVTPDHHLHNVFIHLRQHGKQVLLTASQGYIEDDSATGERYLVLVDGSRYEGLPGSAQFRILHFAKHGLLLRVPPPPTTTTRLNTVPTSQLWGATDPRRAAELQWRLSVPLAAVLLGLLAVAIGRVKPRKGTYGKLFAAVVVYVFYYNLLAIARTWVDKGYVPPSIGIWWVHGSLLLVVALLLMRQYGFAWSWGRLTGRFPRRAEQRP